MAGIFVELGWGQEKVTTTTRREHPLGQLAMSPDGRIFRWGFTDGVIGAGNLVAQKAPMANNDMDLAIQAAAAIGSGTIAVTLGATALTLNQLEDGSIYIDSGTGSGHHYRIRSNAVVASSGTATLTLHETVRIALTTATSQCGLIENIYKDLVVHPTTTVGMALGVLPTNFADNTYGWVQVYGEACVLIEGTVTLGQTVMPSTTTAGAVAAVNFAGTAETPIVGQVTSVVAATTEFGHIFLQLM